MPWLTVDRSRALLSKVPSVQNMQFAKPKRKRRLTQIADRDGVCRLGGTHLSRAELSYLAEHLSRFSRGKRMQCTAKAGVGTVTLCASGLKDILRKPSSPHFAYRLSDSMKSFLILLFGSIFIFMVVMTTRTQMQVSFWDFPRWQPQYVANPWAMATLWDAYFGFTTFFVWVCYKERALGLRLIWFVLIMAFGNIAMSAYVLIQLLRLEPGQPVSEVITRRA